MKDYIEIGGGVLVAGLIAVGGYMYLQSGKEVQTSTETIPATQNTAQGGAVTATNTVPAVAPATVTPEPNNTQKIMNQQAIIRTNKGDITVELRAETPVTTENFVKLASSNFYDGVKFHRVISGFMIQAGDPQSKDEALKARWGTGGPGYKFNDELTGQEKYTTGTLAMANAGPNTNGSQFFIVTAQPGVALPPSYTVFGKVISGLDVALAIEKVQTDGNDRPLEDVVITSIDVK